MGLAEAFRRLGDEAWQIPDESVYDSYYHKYPILYSIIWYIFVHCWWILMRISCGFGVRRRSDRSIHRHLFIPFPEAGAKRHKGLAEKMSPSTMHQQKPMTGKGKGNMCCRSHVAVYDQRIHVSRCTASWMGAEGILLMDYLGGSGWFRKLKHTLGKKKGIEFLHVFTILWWTQSNVPQSNRCCGYSTLRNLGWLKPCEPQCSRRILSPTLSPSRYHES